MKIVSSCMQDINLNKGQCHTMAFQSSRIQMEFRELLTDFFKNRTTSEYKYLQVLDNNGNKIRSRDFHPIIFECNVINLSDQKSTEKVIKDLLYHQLENNPNLLHDYLNFTNNMEQFLSKIEIKSGDIIIDFQLTEKTISQFIRSLEISIDSYRSKNVSNYDVRNFLIKSLLELNIHHKEVMLIVTYPESDVGTNDYKKIINNLNDLKVTTLILTSHHDFLVSVPKENIFLIDKNGISYDIIGLEKELQTFKLVDRNNVSEIAKRLAFVDFTEDYTLVDNHLKKFLLSNRL